MQQGITGGASLAKAAVTEEVAFRISTNAHSCGQTEKGNYNYDQTSYARPGDNHLANWFLIIGLVSLSDKYTRLGC